MNIRRSGRWSLAEQDDIRRSSHADAGAHHHRLMIKMESTADDARLTAR
jgi:hypothetical protein